MNPFMSNNIHELTTRLSCIDKAIKNKPKDFNSYQYWLPVVHAVEELPQILRDKAVNVTENDLLEVLTQIDTLRELSAYKSIGSCLFRVILQLPEYSNFPEFIRLRTWIQQKFEMYLGLQNFPKSPLEDNIQETDHIGYKQPMGALEVITGCMFSGKTEELVRRLRRAQIAKQNVLVVKPCLDTRTFQNQDITSIESRGGTSINAVLVPENDPKQLLDVCQGSVDVLGIDEIQFFSQNYVETIFELLQKGVRVIVSGLDLDVYGEPFETTARLMALADKLDKFNAICTQCGRIATRTHRLKDTGERILVGSDQYEARCKDHFVKATKNQNTPQTINDWARHIHQINRTKGFWDEPRSFGDICALAHTEISEAYEEYRNGHSMTEIYENSDKPGKPEGIPVELADEIIRCLDVLYGSGVTDINSVIDLKVKYNMTRPFKHNKIV